MEYISLYKNNVRRLSLRSKFRKSLQVPNWIFPQKLFRRLFHGAYNGAMKAMHEQGEVEKRDAPEDETEDARDEV